MSAMEKMQNLLVAYCKKKSRDLHRVKSEEVKRQTENQIGTKNDLRERQQQNLLDSFKDAYWLNQQFYSPRFWNKSKKSMYEFEKIIAQSKKMCEGANNHCSPCIGFLRSLSSMFKG